MIKMFAAEVCEKVKARLGEEYHIQVKNTVKNNNLKLTGLEIRKVGEDIAPIIYLDRYFENPLNNMGDAVDNIVELALQPVPAQEDMGQFMNYEEVKEKLRFNVVNFKANKELLRTRPHVPYLDLAVIFYVMIEKGGQVMTSHIDEKVMNLWKVSAKQLYLDAAQNMMNDEPAQIKNLKEIIAEIDIAEFDEELANAGADDLKQLPVGEVQMYVLTNESNIMGASCMLYEPALKNFADKKGCNFIILPSSIHETLLIEDTEDGDYGKLGNMVREINASMLCAEDILSNSIYLYDRNKRKISIVFQGDSI